MVHPLKVFASLFMRPPKFRFNQELYEKLVRERENGASITAPEKEPEVEFAPAALPDGTLGEFNSATHQITIDVMQNYLAAITGQEKGPADLAREFDERMTQTLAHEGGHWNLAVRYGWLPIVEKVAIHFAIFLPMVAIAYLGYAGLVRLAIRIVPWAYARYAFPGGIAAAILAAPVIFGLWRLFTHAVSFAKVAAFALTYQLCWTERYARKCETRPDGDPRWQDVIQMN